ncbi:hypothetical protein Tco_0984983 [Tanacetum coccineum]
MFIVCSLSHVVSDAGVKVDSEGTKGQYFQEKRKGIDDHSRDRDVDYLMFDVRWVVPRATNDVTRFIGLEYCVGLTKVYISAHEVMSCVPITYPCRDRHVWVVEVIFSSNGMRRMGIHFPCRSILDGGKTDVGEGLGAHAVLPLLTSYSDLVSMVDSSSEFNVRFLKSLAVCPNLLKEWTVWGRRDRKIPGNHLERVEVPQSKITWRLTIQRRTYMELRSTHRQK